MTKFTTILLTGLTALFFTACGGGSSGNSNGGNTPAPPTTVNLVGTWNYSLATSGSICDGLIAQAVEIVEPYNGDNSVVGNIILDGTKFAIDSNGNCYLAPLYSVDTSYVGKPSNMTKAEYMALSREQLAGIGTIESFDVINFNNNIISTQTNVVNNITIYGDMERQ